MNIADYKTLVFDCDGVVLDSNKVKTDSFYQTALPYGELQAQKLVDYHIANGGVSRHKKFHYFFTHILGKSDFSSVEIQALLDSFANLTWKGLLNCEIATGLEQLRAKTSGSRWLIVSGGEQNELRHLFASRNLTNLFDGGIFGSPDSKEKILDREMKNKNIFGKAAFLGDSKYDHQVATNAGLEFIFVRAWSELKEQEKFILEFQIQSINRIGELI